jgi:RHS repeat-associated protein
MVVARYSYDPFGNVLSKSGPLAEANVYRFSSKEAHAKSGLSYYLYRFYDPNPQRWLSRDPLADIGSPVHQAAAMEPWDTYGGTAESADGDIGDVLIHVNINLYAPLGGDPIDSVDSLGLQASLCNPAGAAIVADAEAAAEGYASLAAKQAAMRAAARAAAAAAAAAATLSGDRAETTQHGKGERNRQHESDNPWKGWRVDPKDPSKIRGKDQNGKDIVKRRPPGFPDPKCK